MQTLFIRFKIITGRLFIRFNSILIYYRRAVYYTPIHWRYVASAMATKAKSLLFIPAYIT